MGKTNREANYNERRKNIRLLIGRNFAIVIFVMMMTMTMTAMTAAMTAAYAQLSKETTASILINGPPVNFTADQQDLDISIDATDPLPANGTVTISTFGATDTDINGFPPVDVSVIIQNDSVTVTNHTIDIGTDLSEEAALQAIESNDDGDEDDDDDDEGN